MKILIFQSWQSVFTMRMSIKWLFFKGFFRSKGVRLIADKRINVNIKNAFFALVFWILIFTLYYLVYYFLTDLKNSMPNYIFVISLIVSAVFYTVTMLIVSRRFISIVLNKKRFNKYISSKT